MTPNSDELSNFLLELYRDARLQPPAVFQQNTLVRLRNLLPFDFAAWGGGAGGTRQISTVVTLGRPLRLFDQWSAGAAIDSYCDLALRRLDRTILFDDIPGFRESSAYREHWRRFDVRHALTTIMAEPIAGYVSFLGLCNTDRERRYGEPERRFKQLLMPHIASALRLCHESQVLPPTLAGEGVALVNGAGVILASRPPFTRLMRKEWGDGRPCMPAAVLAKTPLGTTWRGDVIHMRIERLGPYFRVRVRCCAPLELLAPREQQVAERFAFGRSHKEVAHELGLAPATVRNQIAAIYDKLGVSDKGQLASLIHGVGSGTHSE